MYCNNKLFIFIEVDEVIIYIPRKTNYIIIFKFKCYNVKYNREHATITKDKVGNIYRDKKRRYGKSAVETMHP